MFQSTAKFILLTVVYCLGTAVAIEDLQFFTQQEILPSWCSGSSRYVLWADVNGDGVDDVLCFQSSTGTLWARENFFNTKGEFIGGKNFAFPLFPNTQLNIGSWCKNSRLYMANLNSDKFADIVCKDSRGTTHGRIGNGQGRFTNVGSTGRIWHDSGSSTDGGRHCNVASGAYWRQFDFVDINNDGISDVICHRYDDGSLSLKLGLGDGRFENVPMLKWCTGSSTKIYFADVNGDGKDEYICHNNANGNFYVRTWGANTLGPVVQDLSWCKGYSKRNSLEGDRIQFADLNGDGRDDLICQTTANSGSQVHVAYGTPDLTFVKRDNNKEGRLLNLVDFCKHDGGITQFAFVDGDSTPDAVCIDAQGGKVKAAIRDTQCPTGQVGSFCEINICNFVPNTNNRWTDAWLTPPRDFDWDLHMPQEQDIQVKQVYRAGNPPKLGLTLEFTPVSQDLNGYDLIVNNKKEDTMVEAAQNCVNPVSMQFANGIVVDREDASVGTEFALRIDAKWAPTSSKLPGNLWVGKTSVDRRQLTKTLSAHVIEFMTAISFKASDTTAQFPIEGIQLKYWFGEVADEPTNYLSETDSEGQFDITLQYPDTTAAETQLHVRAFKKTDDFTHEIAICSSAAADPSTCEVDTVVTFDVEHLPRNPHEIYLMDRSVKPVMGSIDYVFESTRCGIAGANVTLTTTRGQEIAKLVTDSLGEFAVAIPLTQQVEFEFEYFDHTFQAKDSNVQPFMSPFTILGDTVVPKIEVNDVTQRSLTIGAGVTACAFPVGPFTATVTSKACPDLNRVVTVTTATTFPAHEFSVDMNFDAATSPAAGASVTKEDITDRFQSIHDPTPDLRVVDMTHDDQTFQFNYHAIPEVSFELDHGYVYKAFPATCKDRVPVEDHFDVALKGNTAETGFLFYLTETYFDGTETHACRFVDDRTTMRVKSDLGVIGDRCHWANTEGEDDEPGCTRGFTRGLSPVDDEEVSVSLPVILAVGQPTEMKEGETIRDILKNIEFAVENKYIWPANSVDPIDLQLNPVKVLILGTEIISADSTISIPEQVPLKLLYAPPTAGNAKWSYAELSTEISLGLTTKVIDTETDKFGGSVSLSHIFSTKTELCTGLFAMVCYETVDVKGSIGTEIGNSNVFKTFNEDSVTFDGEKKKITLKTPPALAGDAGDMALIMGVVAKYVRSKLHTFNNQNSCSIDVREQTVWDKRLDALLYLSMRDSKGEVAKARDTVRVQEATLIRSDISAAERRAAEQLRIEAAAAVTSWQSLIAFWEKDKLDALNYPVDLSELTSDLEEGTTGNLGGPQPNLINMGAGTVTLSETFTGSKTNLIDYDSYTHDISTNFNGDTKVKVFGIGLKVGVKADYSHSWSYDKTETEEEQTVNSYSVVFYEDNPEDNIAMQVYRSPFSGTYVFKTFGGLTRCPHLPGTDAHQKVEVDLTEQPYYLDEDSGRFVLEVSTDRMEDFSSGVKQSIDLVIELDSESSTFPVAFNIGGSSLNEPFKFDMDAGETQSVYVYFERLQPDLNRITVNGVVRSECDGSIRAPFALTVGWETPCASIGWGGDLDEPLSTWVISADDPSLDLVIKNLNSKVAWNTIRGLEISIWYLAQDRPGSTWELLPKSLYGDVDIERLENDDHEATIKLDEESIFTVLNNGERYLLEIRANCPDTDSRSGPRLGLVDTQAPSLLSWKTRSSVKTVTRSIELAGMMFSEAIDCTSPDLTAQVKVVGTSYFPAQVVCAARAHQLTVLLPLPNVASFDIWSNATVELHLSGLKDLSGNAFKDSLQFVSDLDIPDGTFTRTFKTLDFAAGASEALPEWTIPDTHNAENVLEAQRFLLPEAKLTSFSEVGDGKGSGLGAGAIAGIVIGSVVGVAVVVGVGVKRARQGSQTDVDAVGTEVNEKALLEVDNPLFVAVCSDTVSESQV